MTDKIPKIPLGSYVERAIDFITENFQGFFGGIKNILTFGIDGIEELLNLIPAAIFIVVAACLAWWLAGKGMGIFTLIGLFLIHNLGLWQHTLQTLALVGTSTIIALIIGLPLGIIMSKSVAADKIIRPVLDFMQKCRICLPFPRFISLTWGEVPGLSQQAFSHASVVIN